MRWSRIRKSVAVSCVALSAGCATLFPRPVPVPVPEPVPVTPVAPPVAAENLENARRQSIEEQFDAEFGAAKSRTAPYEQNVVTQTQISEHLPSQSARELHEVAHQRALASRRKSDAEAHAQKWLLSCGPDEVRACRTEALKALEASLPPERLEEVAVLRSHEACVEQAWKEDGQRATKPTKDCLVAAGEFYTRTKDGLMLSMVRLLEAKQMPTLKKKIGLHAVATTVCQEPRCKGVRNIATIALEKMARSYKDKVAAAQVRLAELHLSNPGTHAPAKELLAACGTLDRAKGVGACRRIQRAEYSRVLLPDFSDEKYDETFLFPQ